MHILNSNLLGIEFLLYPENDHNLYTCNTSRKKIARNLIRLHKATGPYF